MPADPPRGSREGIRMVIRTTSLSTVATDTHHDGHHGADETTRQVPFVMVTAEAKVENVVAARQAGVNNYVIKPFTLAVLKQKLASVLGEL